MQYLFTFARLLLLFGLLVSAATSRAQGWQWAIQTASTGGADITKSVVDASGNLYVIGSSTGTTALGAATVTTGGYFVAKFSSAGAWQWVVPLDKDAVASALALDASGNPYFTGYTTDTATFGATTFLQKGLCTVRMTSAGAFTWARQVIPGFGTTKGQALQVDAAGNIYVAGATLTGLAAANLRPAAPATTDTLRVGFPSMTVAPAGHFRLPLVVQAGPACGGLQGEIAWNPAALRFVGIATTLPGLVVGVPDTAAGHLPVLWTDPAGQPLHGPATLVEVEFATRLGTPPGIVTLVDGPRTALVALDSALAPLTLRVVAGILSVGPVVQGVAGSLAESAALRLWPNPAHEAVHLTGAPGALVTVSDALGRPVRTARLDGSGATTLVMRGLPAGLYVVRAGRTARQLVVE